VIRIDANTVLVAQALDRLRSAMADLAPVMRDIAATLQERISERFETQTDPAGAAWRPVDFTLASYPNDGNRRILDRSGHMLDSLNWQARRADSATGSTRRRQHHNAGSVGEGDE
jgi:phage gpG-like protein